MECVVDALTGPEASPLLARVASSTFGPLIAMARNQLVEKFLTSDLEWLWCVDTDIVFRTNAVDRLWEIADPITRPIVSALYFIPSAYDDKVPAIYRAVNESGRLVFRPLKKWPENSLLKVDAVGAGCMLVHRSVFEKIQKDHDGDPCWFRECVINQRPMGEDLSFCVRAAGAGFPVHADTSVQVGHMKTIMIGHPT